MVDESVPTMRVRPYGTHAARHFGRAFDDSQRIRDQRLQVELEPTLAKTRNVQRTRISISILTSSILEKRGSTSSVSRGGPKLTALLAIVGRVRKHFVLGLPHRFMILRTIRMAEA
jgi:P2-related tail formation protein